MTPLLSVKLLLSVTPLLSVKLLLSVTPLLSVKLLLSVTPSLSVKHLLSVWCLHSVWNFCSVWHLHSVWNFCSVWSFCYLERFHFNNTPPSSERGPRFLIVGRKRVSAYDLWQCPCYRFWPKKKKHAVPKINRGQWGSVEPWSFCECVSWELTSNFWRWTLLEISGLAHSFQKQMRTFRSSRLRNWSMGVWPWLLLVGPLRKLLHAMLIIFPSWRAACASFETWFIAKPDRVRSSRFGFHWQLSHPIWTYCWLMLTILLNFIVSWFAYNIWTKLGTCWHSFA